MTLKREKITVHKWMLKVFEMSTFGKDARESTVEVSPINVFPHTVDGKFFFDAPSKYVLDAETLRAVADHLDELAEAYVPPEVDERPKKKNLF